MKPLTLGLVLVLLAALLGTAPTPALANSFVVDSNADDNMAHDKNPGDGLCASWFNECTLRAAIEEANAHSGDDTITFQSAMNIYVNSTVGALPTLTDYVTIDASGVWNSTNDKPGVMLNGGRESFNGLTIAALYCEVYGLLITNFGNAIYVYSSNDTIGGTASGQRNVLSGNTNGSGVALVGSNANSNTVQGNYIGLSTTGDTKQPNYYGVYIAEGASFNTIQYNWISGNSNAGVYITIATSYDNKLSGNVIGLAADNSTALGNSGHGVVIYAASTTEIGGPGLGGNVIASNHWSGIYLNQAPATSIQDNTINGNTQNGIYIFDSSNSEIYFNVIAYNAQNGVLVQGASAIRNQISGNSIHDNAGKGISIVNGGNNGLASPTITTANGSGASGTAAGGARFVQVYSDGADEGQTYHGQCIVNTVTNQWTYSGAISGPKVTALSFDADGNTSEFSAPLKLGYQVFLPLAVRNH